MYQWIVDGCLFFSPRFTIDVRSSVIFLLCSFCCYIKDVESYVKHMGISEKIHYTWLAKSIFNIVGISLDIDIFLPSLCNWWHYYCERHFCAAEGDITEKPIEPIKVYSEKELIREIEKIASTLVPEKDWSIRIAAMQKVEGLVSGGWFTILFVSLLAHLSVHLFEHFLFS